MKFIPRTKTRARIDVAKRYKLRRGDVFLCLFALLYEISTSATSYLPPLFGLAIFVFAQMLKTTITWGMVALFVATAAAELLHGFYAFGFLASAFLLRFLVLERLKYKLVAPELAIFVAVFCAYALLLAYNYLIFYALNIPLSAPSGLFAYYAAIEAAIACIIARGRHAV